MAEFQPVVVAKRPNYWLKRIVYILLVLIVIFGAYYLYKNYFQGKSYKSQNVTPVNSVMLFPNISSDGKSVVYFDQINRNFVTHIFTDDADQSDIKYPCSFLPESGKITNIKWSTDQKQAYLFWLDGQNTKIFYVDVTNKKNSELISGIFDISFMGEKSVYILNKAGYSLNLANPDGKNSQSLLPLQPIYTNLQPSADNSKIVLWGLATNGEKSLAVFTVNSALIKEIDSGLISLAQFSPDGNKILYSKMIDSQNHLYVTDTNSITDLKISNYPGQLLWSDNDNIIVVAFETKKDGTNFIFYKENVSNTKKKEVNRLVVDEENDPYYSAISKDQKNLYFVNGGYLQKVSL